MNQFVESNFFIVDFFFQKDKWYSILFLDWKKFEWFFNKIVEQQVHTFLRLWINWKLSVTTFEINESHDYLSILSTLFFLQKEICLFSCNKKSKCYDVRIKLNFSENTMISISEKVSNLFDSGIIETKICLRTNLMIIHWNKLFFFKRTHEYFLQLINTKNRYLL